MQTKGWVRKVTEKWVNDIDKRDCASKFWKEKRDEKRAKNVVIVVTSDEATL